ncbi:hypothetical protein MFRU_001g02680 [Monilinia fructicola]|nr:hypothetical protein MFRU_001g02680 [Monilinia fructicola]
MFRKLVTVTSPERLRRARELQDKLLVLISTARVDFLTAGTHQETKLRFKWVFQSSEYDGFPSKPEEMNDIFPLPQKIAITWSLEEIDRCVNAIDRGFVKIITCPRSRAWTRLELQKSLKSRMYDFIESSLGRRLLPRARNVSTISNDSEVNFYRWEFGEGYPGFLYSSFSLWPHEKYLELSKALDSGALKIVSTVANAPLDNMTMYQAPQSTEIDGTTGAELHRNNSERQKSQMQISQSGQSYVHHSVSMVREKSKLSTDACRAKSSIIDAPHRNTNSSKLLSNNGSSPKYNVKLPTSGSAQRDNVLPDIAAGERERDMSKTDLMKLCNQAWMSLESRDRANGHEHNNARAILNTGLSYAIQLKDQIQIVNNLEHENHNLKLQILQLKRSQASLQQQLCNTQESNEKDISNARLEGEKIAENNVKMLFYSAKEQGRVIGVRAMKDKYRKEGYSSASTNHARLVQSSQPLDAPSAGMSGFIPQKIPSMCADETRSHLSKATVPYPPPRSDPTSPADAIPPLSTSILRKISDLETHHSHHQTPVTNASVQIPPTTRGFHKSFLNEVLGPINCTLNSIPPSHIPNSVKWSTFFTIHLDTQPYIFPLPNPSQTYGQVVHFISQSATEAPRATQGTSFPVLLKTAPDVEQYYYIGHFVVSNVVTTTDLNQVLKNLPDNDENTKHTKHKLLKARDRALGSATSIARNGPVDFYTLQYVFFGEEQYKILVRAQEKFEALKSANNTINLLLEQRVNHNGSASSPLTHKTTPAGPTTMTRRLSPVSSLESLAELNDHNATSQPIHSQNRDLNEPLSMRRKRPFRTDNEEMPKSEDFNTMSPSVPRANKSPTQGSAPTSRRQSSGAKDESLSCKSRRIANTTRTSVLPSHKSLNESSTTKRKLPFGDSPR